jgi:hypothetical protein
MLPDRTVRRQREVRTSKQWPCTSQAAILYTVKSEFSHLLIRLASIFIDRLQVVTTNNYYTLADFRTTNHSTLSLLGLHSTVVAW